MKGLTLFETYTPVYYWNRDCDKKIIVNQGGTSSSKTISILQVICRKLATSKRKLVVTVVGQDMPNISVGALRDFKTLVGSSDLLQILITNPGAERGPYRWTNGSIIEFKAYENAQDAKSGKRDYAFINEANGIHREIAEEIIVRTTYQVFIDYNSTRAFWVHEDFIGKENVQLFISNYTHNKFVDDSIIERILGYKTKWKEKGTQYWKNRWRVYGLGLTGATEGTIFEAVNFVDRFPVHAKAIAYGLDWGYSNDPTAICRCGIIGEDIYCEEVFYKNKTNSRKLLTILPQLGITPNDLIIADTSNPDGISILREAGYTVMKAKKYANSILTGLDQMLTYNINITRRSKNWEYEQMNYVWKMIDGKAINTPERGNDHLWDAARYWFGRAVNRYNPKSKVPIKTKRRAKLFN